MSSTISVPGTDFETATGTGKPTLVDFWAAWCGPCLKLSPVLDEIAEEHPEYAIVKVDIEAAPDLALKYQVTGVPRILVLDANGEVRSDFVGPKPKRVLLDELARV